jgi:hypothetical protein
VFATAFAIKKILAFFAKNEARKRTVTAPEWTTEFHKGKEYQWKETPFGYAVRSGGKEESFKTSSEVQDWLTAN